MSDIDPNARREVNNALISSGSAAVSRMVEAANSSVEKRRHLKEERERGEAEEKAAAEKAAKEKADAAVRTQPPSQPSKKLTLSITE
jgi:hypothetical protein